jgi:hypothetical protein
MSQVVGRSIERLGALRNRLGVNWLSVAILAVVLAYADGFWLTSVQGTVGAIERNHAPVSRWLRDSTLMLPLFFLGVLAALLVVRRLFGDGRRVALRIGAAALLITLIGSAVGTTEVMASSAYDYRLQSRDLARIESQHTHPAVTPGSVATPSQSGCTGTCAQRQLTLTAHVEAVELIGRMLLITNGIAVLWVLAFRGDRLWRRKRSVDDVEVADRRLAVGAVPA